ncbi:MAG: hypothetical protein LBE82_05200 [Chitinophagaceae bacterium]|jgi:hypothetical protein|nr:hypothetical protein [Chitinophagaceae bacterium]
MKFLRALLAAWLLSLAISCGIATQPISPEEAKAFGNRIEKEITAGKPDILNNIFDITIFSGRISDALKDKSNFFIRQSLKGELANIKLGSEVVKAKGKDGSYSLIKSYEKDGKRHLLFRLYSVDHNINYHDFELVKRDGHIKAADAYIYTSGEMFSTTLANLYIGLKDAKEKDGNLPLIMKLNKLIAQKQYKQAIKIYNNISPQVQKDKAIQLIHISICQSLDDSLYKNALDEYARLYPNEPNAHLLLIDKCFLENDYPKALEHINKLDSIINKDPFQDYYRGLVYKAMDSLTQAGKCFEALRQNMPAFYPGLYQLIKIYAEEKKYPEAKAVLAQYKQNPSTDKDFKIEELYLFYPKLKD